MGLHKVARFGPRFPGLPPGRFRVRPGIFPAETSKWPEDSQSYDPVKAGNITIACCVLRSIAIDAKETNNYDSPEHPNPLYEEPVPDSGPPSTDAMGAKFFMRRIIEDFF
ncbi:hypothetical protein ANCDUO_26735 [Ancylostoma duodenale]|uniref:Uncharacterized protein n=1 Tax=Ancylostoma duodenale TaxID=51022 RepID=A0A0C2BHM1_9BILA|nr:hypothetical protein ANCDUO_26735 [Ancylostoma duodenale]